MERQYTESLDTSGRGRGFSDSLGTSADDLQSSEVSNDPRALGIMVEGSEGEEDEGPPVEEEIEDEGYDDAVRTSPFSVFGQGQTAWEVGSKRGIFSAMCGAFSDQKVSSCEAETA